MRLSLLLLLILCIEGCTYSPSGSNFLDIPNEVEPVQVFVNLSPVYENADTFNVFSSVKIDYNFEIGDKEIREILFWLDSDTLIDFPKNGPLDQSNTFFLNTKNYPDGVQKLNFRLLTSSATNSLSDRMGAEIVPFEGSWILNIDNAPPTGVPIISAERKDGSLELRWEKYQRPDFSLYLPRRGEYNGLEFSPFVFFDDYRITERDVTSAFDRLYVGGIAYYRIEISPVDIFPRGFGQVFKFEDEYPQFTKIDTTVANKLKFTWSSCKYPLNFGFYRLEEIGSGKSWTFTNVADTTFTLDLPQSGVTQEYWLRTRPANHLDGRTDIIDKITLQ